MFSAQALVNQARIENIENLIFKISVIKLAVLDIFGRRNWVVFSITVVIPHFIIKDVFFIFYYNNHYYVCI